MYGKLPIGKTTPLSNKLTSEPGVRFTSLPAATSNISMHELNEVLLGLPIDLQVAQHLEGNLVAQFYLSTDSMQVDYDYGHYVPNLIGFKIK